MTDQPPLFNSHESDAPQPEDNGVPSLADICAPALQALADRSLRTDDGMPSGARSVRVPEATMRHLNTERARHWPPATNSELICSVVSQHIAGNAGTAPITEGAPRGPKGTRADLHSVSVIAPLAWWRALNAYCALTGRTQSQVLAEALSPKALRVSR